jgi:hypothetical protein
MATVGIDIGSQKTIIVSHDGERILTATGENLFVFLSFLSCK